MGKFATVVIDPPWDISLGPNLTKSDKKWGGTLTALPYPTMPLANIAAIPIESVLADDAWLFCWTVNQMLPATFGLIEAWGCRYCFTMTWQKPNGPQFPNIPKFNAEWIVAVSYTHLTLPTILLV